MEIKNHHPQIYIIGGKARTGKDKIAQIIAKYYTLNKKKTVCLKYTKYIRDYAQNLTDWNGEEDSKPRTFLQELGTEVIRKHVADDFFTRRMMEDIQVYSFFVDAIIISGARTIMELECLKERFDQVVTIGVRRPNHNNGLTEEQKNHSTEVELDGYSHFDYEIINQNEKDLQNDILKIIEEVEHEFKR